MNMSSLQPEGHVVQRKHARKGFTDAFHF